jgi:hypothetical protein
MDVENARKRLCILSVEANQTHGVQPMALHGGYVANLTRSQMEITMQIVTLQCFDLKNHSN